MNRKTFDELKRLCEILKYARHVTKRASAQRDLEKYGPIAIPELIEGIRALVEFVVWMFDEDADKTTKPVLPKWVADWIGRDVVSANSRGYKENQHLQAAGTTRAEALAEAMNELKIQASVTKVELRNDDSKTAKILRGLIAQWQNMIDTALAAYREETK